MTTKSQAVRSSKMNAQAFQSNPLLIESSTHTLDATTNRHQKNIAPFQLRQSIELALLQSKKPAALRLRALVLRG
ncbi:hypothetical protein G7048_01015 [Diaphorobacter sp. HDW4B]|uniref:hypothetical protein n=1 Tax=Diaphorobacter sp. HDW4B TaxID=2714925 RepID=UPI00140D54D8|nr:hypothetical protein [Diaphorobacter sp. HDW4B]QIL69097.1 hypothetical protein G7048_01015 [Diaphorobacter sp. HDW4B]